MRGECCTCNVPQAQLNLEVMYILTLLDREDEERVKILQDAFDKAVIINADHYQPGYGGPEGYPPCMLELSLLTIYHCMWGFPKTLEIITTATNCDTTFPKMYTDSISHHQCERNSLSFLPPHLSQLHSAYGRH